MQTITEQQRQSLEERIYMSFMANPELGMGEMGEARDEANRIVSEWMEKEKIVDLDPNTTVKFLFEQDETNEVFAYFPEIVHNGEYMTAYSHIGQHSACHPDYAENCVEAPQEYYSPLLCELMAQGYNNLTILNKDK